MTAEEFKLLWISEGDSIIKYEIKNLLSLNLQKTTMDFLTKGGLPNSAAPFLNFDEKLETLNNYYNFDNIKFDDYIVIGTDGCGDPIVINTSQNDIIECLNHDDDFLPRFFNSSLNQFCQFVLNYRNFINLILKENGQNALMDGIFSDEQYKGLYEKFNVIDSKAIKEGYWKDTLEYLLFERENQ